MLFAHIDLLRANTEAGGIVWNPAEQCMSDLHNALHSVALRQVANETDLEQELSNIKITKDFMNSNPLKK